MTALPYHAMITYTGIVTLMFMYLPWGIKARYASDEMRFYDEAANRVADTRKAAGVPAHMLPLEQFVARARSGGVVARWAAWRCHCPTMRMLPSG